MPITLICGRTRRMRNALTPTAEHIEAFNVTNISVIYYSATNNFRHNFYSFIEKMAFSDESTFSVGIKKTAKVNFHN